MQYPQLPSFTDLDTLDKIRDASQRGPFLTTLNVECITDTFDNVIKIMGKGNLNGIIKKLDPELDADKLRLVEMHRARLVNDVQQVQLCIDGATRSLIVFDGDNWQYDSPFTSAILALAKLHNCPVLSVRGHPANWRPDHVDATTGRPKCTVGTWPSDMEMRMAWVDGATPAEVTLRMANRVVVYGAADLFDGAASTTTSKEMQRFEDFGIDTTPLASCADNPSYWSVYGKVRP